MQTAGAYAQWQPLASALVDTFTGTADDCATDNSTNVPATGTTKIPAGFALPAGTPAQVVTAIAYALRQLGKPYLWGGVGPTGYDCSGLVMMAYQAAGVSIPRTTFEQVSVGTPVYSLSQLQPGDLIFTPGYLRVDLSPACGVTRPQHGVTSSRRPVHFGPTSGRPEGSTSGRSATRRCRPPIPVMAGRCGAGPDRYAGRRTGSSCRP